MIQTILDLPTSLSAAILCNWLDLKSVCCLDSAVCEKSLRATHLGLLKSLECKGQLNARSNEQLVWLNERLIKSTKFTMMEDFSEYECRKFFERSGRYVHQLFQSCLVPSEAFLHMTALYCNNLTVLFLSVKTFKDESLALLRINTNLRELTLRFFAPFSLADISLPNLEYVKLVGYFVDDATCISLAKGSARLRFLSISSESVTSAGLLEAARLCPQLRCFQAPDLRQIDNTLLRMMPLCANIEHIRFTTCLYLTDVGIHAVAKNAKGLRSIQIRYSPNITNACLVSLAEHQHRTLEIFVVVDSFFFPLHRVSENNKQTFNIEAVTKFRETCTQLRVFEWERSMDFLDRCPAEDIIPHVETADRVTVLTLGQVDDAVLHTIAQHCTQLKVFNLYDVCDSMKSCSDAMFLKVVEECRNLTALIVVDSIQRERLQSLLTAYPQVAIEADEHSLSAYGLDNLYRINL